MSGDEKNRRLLYFDGYELNCATSELVKDGRKLKLQPQPAVVLALLASRAGELVTREELRYAIWGSETTVDFERSLNFCIRKVRSVLRDEAEHPRFLETLPKRGYRFLADVRVEHQTASAIDHPARAAPRWRRILAAGVGIGVAIAVTLVIVSRPSPIGTDHSISVLPFVDLSGNRGASSLSDGITKELTELLSTVPELRVTGRPSALALAGDDDMRRVAETLQVRYLLKGSVRGIGARVSVNAQVLDPGQGSTVWSGNFDRPSADMAALAGEIAAAVITALRVGWPGVRQATTEKRRIRDPETYATYLQAVRIGERLTRESFQQSVRLLQSVIEREPAYAPAQASLASVYLNAGVQGLHSPEEMRQKARLLAARAAALDPDSIEALTVSGNLAMSDFRWNAAEVTFRRAIRLSPSYAEAHLLLAYSLLIQGKADEGFLEAERGWRLDPLSSEANRNYGNLLFYGHRYQEAIRVLDRATELDPSFTWNHYSLARVHVQEGNCQKATAAAAEHTRLVGVPSTIRALVLTRCGSVAEARAALTGIRSSASVAAVYAMLGDKEAALRILEESIDTSFGPAMVLRINPEFASLANEPRFLAILRRIHVAD